MNDNLDLCQHFADFVARTRYDDLPGDAIEGAKKTILDTLGVTLAASGMEPAVRALVELVQQGGGSAESTVLGFGGKLPAISAAFANGSMAHCLDFDDQTPWGAHAASSIVPSVFAIAERMGGVSGKKLITAVAVGQDLFARIRCNVGWNQNWNLSSMVGAFSATASAAHLLGLSAEQTSHALGIASQQSCGTMEVIFATGSDLRGMYAGFTAKGAVIAALLAQKGITGINTLFEGKAGIFKVYFGGKYDRDKMLHGLGEEFLGATTLYKAWPAVGNSHTYIHATIELMKEAGITAADIETIRAFVGDFTKTMCTPIEVRRAPATIVDAKMSLPFIIGVAASKGRMGISDFSEAALKDPEVLAMAAKVVPVEDPGQNWTFKLPDGRIEIVTRDGRTFERLGDNIPGSPEAPLTWSQLSEKFASCAAVAAKPPTEAAVRRARELVQQLESVDDATDVIGALS
ncbi:MmgE/PrpD family protein [Caballeronia sp. LZ008]|uniref:MmgE/PrpD family protein n=1 Tax=unclassified Caballeronia TaxID=2646786 RepID=UPI00202963F2|nr:MULTISPECIES: MmgE/PrpD family protein [unclassified Caballeronia]MDR5796459.1 MmgE/PrpD family protein [Caballeronia sp. LZ008]